MDDAGEFLFRVFGDLATAAIVGCLYLGDRTGLFAAMRGRGWTGAEQLASAAGLQERYVREWLAAMAASGYVEYDPRSREFRLPDAHASVLADPSDTKFMGGVIEMVPAALRTAPLVAAAFRDGGGVPFDAFGVEMFEGIARANAPTLRNHLGRFWLPASGRARLRIAEGARMLDVGCGEGASTVALARAAPASRVVGIDPHSRSIDRARALAAEEGLDDRVSFRCEPVEALTEEQAYGVAFSMDVVHDLPHPLGALRAVHRALQPQGVYLMAEPNCASAIEDNLNPVGAFYYAVSTLHCLTQSLAADGAGLGAAWGREAAESLSRDAGFGGFAVLDVRNPVTALYELTP